jgi:protein TonB
MNTPSQQFGTYLNQQHFMSMLLLAFLLHAAGIALYQILPRDVIEMIPVRVLNIKIGKMPAPESIPTTKMAETKVAAKIADTKPKPTPQPKAVAKPIVKKAAPRPVVREKIDLPTVASIVPTPQMSNTKSITEAAREAAMAKQYVREDNVVPKTTSLTTSPIKSGLPAGYGSPLGNSTQDSAEIESRYTQTLSLWINKFKVYPTEARQAGIGGTVMLRLRINRQGRIMQYYLEKASGFAVIDQAISSMVNAANPVPAVPPYYPDSRPYLEFLVPIHFKP